MRTSSFLFANTWRISMTVCALAVAGCSAPPEADPQPAEQLGVAVEDISASDAISRAEEWVTAKLQYCQSPYGQDDSIDPSCSPICNRQENPAWDPYRSDCSGLVSWAWGLPAPGRTTAEFAPNQNDITQAIQASNLQTGDAVCTDDSTSSDHHIMLFKGWVVQGQSATFIEEPGCSTNPDYAHEFTSTVSLSGTQITVDYNGMTFTAIHYDQLTTGGSTTTSATTATTGSGSGGTYAAKYVSQSWPLSESAPVQMTQWQTYTGSIDMQNVGTATWKAGVVKLAPIPRDQASNMQAPSWLSPTRVSTIAQDVPPGGTGHFEWDLMPSQPGDFMPYFGLVAEGEAWFADSGGPPDNDIQVNVSVSPGMTAPAASTSATTGSTGSGDATTGTTTGTTGTTGAGNGTASGPGAGSGGNGGASTGSSSVVSLNGSGGGDAADTGMHGGCQTAPGGESSLASLGALAALVGAFRRRRRAH